MEQALGAWIYRSPKRSHLLPQLLSLSWTSSRLPVPQPSDIWPPSPAPSPLWITTSATLLQPTLGPGSVWELERRDGCPRSILMRCMEVTVPAPTGEGTPGTPGSSGQRVPAQRGRSLASQVTFCCSLGQWSSPPGLSFLLTSHIPHLFLFHKHHYLYI